MATQFNIEKTHKGEPIIICLLAKDSDGSVIQSPALQEIIFTVSKTAKGNPFIEISGGPEIVLNNASTGEWLIELDRNSLSGLREDTVYYYNIWSRFEGKTWLQGRGRLKLLDSIEPA